MQPEVVIVGGGLSGLYAASLLHQRGVSFLLLEARAELGGRIHTVFDGQTALELGPSWFWPETNPRVVRLVEALGLESFEQFRTGDALVDHGHQVTRQPHQSVDPRVARRLRGGTQALIQGLVAQLPLELLKTEMVVKRVRMDGEDLTVESEDGEIYHAQRLILAMPLRLLAETVEFSPVLSQELMQAYQETPTWMASEAKVLLKYKEPFWREAGLSGTMLSLTGPLAECHDASHPSGGGALLGFFVINHAQRVILGEQLMPQVLGQLEKFFGPRAGSPSGVEYLDWASEPFTATNRDAVSMGHPLGALPREAESFWDGRLRIAGTEAAREMNGYLEGALEAAERAAAIMD